MSQHNGVKDRDSDLLLTFAIFGIMFFAAYYFLYNDIKYIRLTTWQYYVTWFKGVTDFISSYLPFNITPRTIEVAYDKLSYYEPREYTSQDLNVFSMKLMPFFGIPLVAILAVMYYKLLKLNKPLNKIFTRASLINDQKPICPWLEPVAKLDLDVNIEKGEWAMAKRPLDFCKKYNLLDENYDLKEIKASTLFANQLGDLYSSFEEMKDYEQALFCIFAAYAQKNKSDRELGLQWLGIAAKTFDNPDYSWVKEAYNKYKDSKIVKEVVQKHYYTKTILLRLLQEARGILPTAYFIWLKPKDRVLWFSLNCLGRREHFTECAGVINHYFAELNLNDKILSPYVKDAVYGLKYDVKELVKITDKNYQQLDVE